MPFVILSTAFLLERGGPPACKAVRGATHNYIRYITRRMTRTS